jgi:hypothetical protein
VSVWVSLTSATLVASVLTIVRSTGAGLQQHLVLRLKQARHADETFSNAHLSVPSLFDRHAEDGSPYRDDCGGCGHGFGIGSATQFFDLDPHGAETWKFSRSLKKDFHPIHPSSDLCIQEAAGRMNSCVLAEANVGAGSVWAIGNLGCQQCKLLPDHVCVAR